MFCSKKIRNRIIPHAVSCFFKYESDDDSEESDDDNEGEGEGEGKGEGEGEGQGGGQSQGQGQDKGADISLDMHFATKNHRKRGLDCDDNVSNSPTGHVEFAAAKAARKVELISLTSPYKS